MASLYVIRGSDVGRLYSLVKECTGIGRDADNELQLHDTEVSRHHAAIFKNEDGFEIKDLSSSNGTFLNSARISHQRLKNGDRLQLGRSLLIFTVEVDSRNSGDTPHHDVEIVRTEGDADVSHIRRVLPSDHLSVSSMIAKTDRDVPDSTKDKEVRQREQWEIVYRTALAVSRTMDIDQLVDQILELIFQWIECDRGCILMMNEETQALQPVSRRNRAGSNRNDRMVISQTILDYVIEHSEGVYTNNAQEDARWNTGASMIQMGIREAICVPMQGRYGTVGAIYVDTQTSPGAFVETGTTGRFREEHLKMMVAIGSQAALAIEDTSYYRGMVQAERLAVMGQTIAILSHHIKNILQGVRGGSYLVDDGIKKQDWNVVARGWRIVDRNQERIAALVMDMLTFSKDRVLQLQPADLRILVDDVVELMQTRANEANVQLQWDRPEHFDIVEMDQEALHRAVLNVVSNAIDATQGIEQGQVSISLRRLPESDEVAIDVVDNGPGIPPDQLQKIFSVFESTKGSRGTGLGLPVSRKILQEHRGDIDVISDLGKGTTFSLRWPIRSSREENSVDPLNRPTTF